MRFLKIIICLVLVFNFSSSAWAVPPNWGVFVPTGIQYLGSRAGAIGKEWGCSDCNGYDRTGINHFYWYCCGACLYCPGYLCTDELAFDKYQAIGDYYDCEGNLLEQGSAWGPIWLIIRGTGTIFSGESAVPMTMVMSSAAFRRRVHLLGTVGYIRTRHLKKIIVPMGTPMFLPPIYQRMLVGQGKESVIC